MDGALHRRARRAGEAVSPAPRTVTILAHRTERNLTYGDLTVAEAITTALSEVRGLGEFLKRPDAGDEMGVVTREAYLTSIEIRLDVARDKLREITGQF